ncbi:MAG: hypothetical protein SF070_01190 [Gemmatimonadota bacterium]|nr:hypothetical protein [Gemmatimonadota bacterium]
MPPISALRTLLLAADWSTNPAKRRMAIATRLDDGRYLAGPPEAVGPLNAFFPRLERTCEPGSSVLIGLDHPIGVPLAWARQAGVTAFRPLLAQLGQGDSQSFYEVSNHPTLRQPFYPLPSQVKGATSKAQLAAALGVADVKELLRLCERQTPTRKAAECLFFTLGGAQVGRAAISGWQELLQPSLDRIRLWPFDGSLPTLLADPGFTVAEIYPAEAYGHLGVSIGSRNRTTKRNREHRRAACVHWLTSGLPDAIVLSQEARMEILAGFASEDDFDAFAGLLGMLVVVLGLRPAGEPADRAVREVEGWILGQEG